MNKKRKKQAKTEKNPPMWWEKNPKLEQLSLIS
jgi:hypothetical protein